MVLPTLIRAPSSLGPGFFLKHMHVMKKSLIVRVIKNACFCAGSFRSESMLKKLCQDVGISNFRDYGGRSRCLLKKWYKSLRRNEKRTHIKGIYKTGWGTAFLPRKLEDVKIKISPKAMEELFEMGVSRKRHYRIEDKLQKLRGLRKKDRAEDNKQEKRISKKLCDQVSRNLNRYNTSD